MKKILHITAKILLSLLLALPIIGTLGIMPPPTRELYNTDIAFRFIDMLGKAGYINYMMVIVNAVSIIMLWTKREALAALLITPITINIVGFHLFLDGSLFTSGAVLANILLLLNGYLLWINRRTYKVLWEKS